MYLLMVGKVDDYPQVSGSPHTHSFVSLKPGAQTQAGKHTRQNYTPHNQSLRDFALMIVLSAHHSRVCSPICAQFQLIRPFPHEGNSCHPIC